jgi:hypothetical protein
VNSSSRGPRRRAGPSTPRSPWSIPVARRTAPGRSRRTTQRIGELRGRLTPWERTAPVRELDAQLAPYGPARHRTTRT